MEHLLDSFFNQLFDFVTMGLLAFLFIAAWRHRKNDKSEITDQKTSC